MQKKILYLVILLFSGLYNVWAQPMPDELKTKGIPGLTGEQLMSYPAAIQNITSYIREQKGNNAIDNLQVAPGKKLYGMTTSGGNDSGGTIFSFDPVGNTHTKLFDFNRTNGSRPYGSLVVSGGKLFGMTSGGGKVDFGTFFSFDPSTNTHVKLLDFNFDVNGNFPHGGLLAYQGKLYGMTYFGGIGGNGTIFSFDPAANKYTRLFDFNGNNGSHPYGNLIISGGKLYGMTFAGGSSGFGTIFSFDPYTNAHSRLLDFNSTNGNYPYGSLLESGGKLYGMTSDGGLGTLFSFDLNTNTHLILFKFNYTIGYNPRGNLIEFNGKLYGMTSEGGSNGYGTIFSFEPANGNYFRLFDFSNIDGINPEGSLFASGDKLYGMTKGGGSSLEGTIFSFDPATNIFTKLQDFNGINGSSTRFGAFIEYDPASLPPSVTLTAPDSNQSFSAGSDIIVTADATDTSEGITFVDFYEGNNKLGSDSSAPYSFMASRVPSGTYHVSAYAVSNNEGAARSDTVTINVTACTSTGTILGEGYANIPGTAVADLTVHPSYPGSPSVSAQLSTIEYTTVGDNYGGRLRGYICAPLTGDYVFYISGDDQAGLWVSTDDNPANKQLVAYTTSFTSFRQWDKFGTQQSAPIRLVAGARYYVETLHKESLGADHLSVGWKLPNGAFERPIAASRLSPFVTGTIGGEVAPGGFEQEMRTALSASLEASVMPNPSRSIFTVSLKGKEGQSVQLTVTDILGRVVETLINLQSNTILQLGQNWKPGIYILQVQQGENRKIVKLIKE